MNLLDQSANGTYWCNVIVLKDADLVWEHSFDDPKHQQQTLKGQLATFKLAPIQIQIAPGHYKVMVQLFESRARQKDGLQWGDVRHSRLTGRWRPPPSPALPRLVGVFYFSCFVHVGSIDRIP